MEEELQSLYKLITSYKQSLIKTVDKIDGNILQAVQNFKSGHSLESLSKKYRISLEMIEVLTTFVKVLYTCDSLSENLVSKLSLLDREAKPEKGSRNLNPFSAFSTEVETAASPEPNFFLNLSLGKVKKPGETAKKNQNIEVTTAKEEAEDANLNNSIQSLEVEVPESQEAVIVKKEDASIKRKKGNFNLKEVVKKPQEVVIVKKENTPIKEKKEFFFDLKEDVEKSKTTNSAVKTLLKAPSHDWRAEVVKSLQNKNEIKTFQFKAVSKRESPKTSREKNAIFEICEDELTLKSEFIVTHSESPSEFYVCTDPLLFNNLEEDFNSYLNGFLYVVNKYKSKAEAKANLGNFCFAFISDKRKWFRVEVLDWQSYSVDDVCVQLIDYGEKRLLLYRNLKPMTEFYAKFPKMAIRCHLAAVEPPCVESFRWPRPSITHFNKLCEINENTKFVPIHVYKEGISYSVDFCKLENEGFTVGQLLVKAGYATEIKDAENFLDTISEYDTEEFDNLNEAISGYDAKDEARICPHTDESGRCFKGPKCKLEHSKLSTDGVTTDKVLTVVSALTEVSLPTAGEQIQILITGYVNTCHFYAHILKKQRKALYNDDFQRLHDVMKTNNIVQSYKTFDVLPAIGELVVVKQDMDWFRGKCVGYKNGKKNEIFLVDFGDTIIKGVKDIRVMNDDFLHVPFQAVECILSACQEKKGSSATDSFKFFQDFMQNKILTAYVVESSSPLRLNVQDEEHEIDMGDVLKQYGLGEDRLDISPLSNGVLSCD